MHSLAFILNLISTFIISRDQIRKTNSGEKFVSSLDKGLINFLIWRSDADIKNDLKGLAKVFRYLAISNLILIVILKQTDVVSSVYFLIATLVSVFLWVALEWGTEIKKESIKWIKYMGLLIIAPFIFYLIDCISPTESPKLLPPLASALYGSFGIKVVDPLVVAIATTVILLIGLTIVTVYWFLHNGLVLLAFTLALYLINKLSKPLLTLKENTVINIAYIVFAITTIIMNYGG